ncbi:single-stranded DNA-binding protein [Insolitispirillum peregrinum]|uniref:Single-stranded DNA-binding protein n=1 Tax=Insolitispirillum peregrinum TaxID=80876 RepID=A0A1N7MGN6_9PROT|nr:single-stranded DNA-binding protein [Insolitispirillum peregrinum]SIS85233.1 single-strand binding protein [Insolitispirillum peregrinum]
MSGCLNRVTLIGYLGGDPEQRTTQAGEAVVSFTLATTDSWKDRNSGEKRDRTEWHRVVVFNSGLVKVAGQYLKKGSKAFVEGELRTRRWTDQNGTERFATEVILSQLLLLDRAGSPDGGMTNGVQ